MASTLPLWPWPACSALFQMSSWLASVTFFLSPSVSTSPGGRCWLLKDSCSPSPQRRSPAPRPPLCVLFFPQHLPPRCHVLVMFMVTAGVGPAGPVLSPGFSVTQPAVPGKVSLCMWDDGWMMDDGRMDGVWMDDGWRGDMGSMRAG